MTGQVEILTEFKSKITYVIIYGRFIEMFYVLFKNFVFIEFTNAQTIWSQTTIRSRNIVNIENKPFFRKLCIHRKHVSFSFYLFL